MLCTLTNTSVTALYTDDSQYRRQEADVRNQEGQLARYETSHEHETRVRFAKNRAAGARDRALTESHTSTVPIFFSGPSYKNSTPSELSGAIIGR